MSPEDEPFMFCCEHDTSYLLPSTLMSINNPFELLGSVWTHKFSLYFNALIYTITNIHISILAHTYTHTILRKKTRRKIRRKKAQIEKKNRKGKKKIAIEA